MKSHALALAVTMGLTLLAGCQTYPAPLTAPVGAAAQAPARSGQAILSGRVQFPGYRVAATADDVAKQAVVSLIDANGVTRAAGVTDAEGAFTLYQSTVAFTPAEGGGFVLEVMKQVPTATGTAWVALRTKLKRVGGAWNSITGSTVVVNLATTAVARLDDNDAAVSLDAILGTVSGTTVTAFGPYGQAQVDALVATLSGKLLAGEDPAGPLVYKGDVELNTSDDVAAIAGYDVIDGSLSIRGELSEVALPNLKVVTDYMAVNTGSFSSFEGLSSLTSVRALEISNNYVLVDFTGLENLTGSLDNLSLQYMGSLESLEGLQNVSAIKGITMTSNSQLASLKGLRGLTSLGSLSLSGLSALEDLQGLEGVTTMTGAVTIRSCALKTLRGLDNLAQAGDIVLGSLPALTTLDGGVTEGVGGLSKLETLTKVETDHMTGLPVTRPGDLDIDDIGELTSLTPLAQLTGSVGHLGLRGNPKLLNTNGLGGITSVVELNIQRNAELTSVAGLSRYASGRYLFVYDNPKLSLSCDQPFPQLPGSAVNATNYAMVTIENNGGENFCADFPSF